jgi:hypothetical protein
MLLAEIREVFKFGTTIRIYFSIRYSYRYVAEKNEIHIKDVFHTSCNPQLWEQRIFSPTTKKGIHTDTPLQFSIVNFYRKIYLTTEYYYVF